MHPWKRETPGLPDGPFGYGVCAGCGVAVQRRLLVAGHECDSDRYADHQASRLHWTRAGFDEALHRWLDSPAGRFAQFYARRIVRPGPGSQPGGA
jgi:hypothetical protein